MLRPTESIRLWTSTSQPSRQAHQPPPAPPPQHQDDEAEHHRLAPQRAAGLAHRGRASCDGRSRASAPPTWQRSWSTFSWKRRSRRAPRVIDHPGHEIGPRDAGPLGLLRRQRQRRHAGLGVEFEDDEPRRAGLRIVPAEVCAAEAFAAKLLIRLRAPTASPPRRCRPVPAPARDAR